MVVFVGDEPSKLNVDASVAFIGSKSYPRLIEWISRLRVADYILVNSHNQYLLSLVETGYLKGDTTIALGNKASERLKKRNILHFKLPHPSPRNRKLNSEEFIDSELHKCYSYLKDRNVKNVLDMR